MPSSQSAYLLVGMTALVAGLVGVLAFALLRFGSAVRDMRRKVREGDSERAFVSAALEDAIRRLREQERAMAARAERSERLSDEIVTSLTSGLLVVALDGEVRMLNPSGRRLLRIGEVKEKAYYRTLLAESPALAQVIEECLDTGEPVVRRSITWARPEGAQAARTRKRPDGPGPGDEMHLGVTVSPLFGDGRSPQGAICLFSDLTAVVELEEQIRLKESLARLGELTAGLAHEFRNGLATIHGYARLIEPGQVSAEYAPYVQAIRDETDALGRVVTNFLNFARPVQLTLAPVAVEEIVGAAVDDLRPEIEARGGTVDVRGVFADIEGDEVLLRQALVNLLRNAVEACAAASIVPRLAVEGHVDASQGVLRLAVLDNGPGIDPALRERIFRPFFTTRSRGTGLGLALVQKIVVTHNGRIAVTASDSGGAAFQLTLPLARRR